MGQGVSRKCGERGVCVEHDAARVEDSDGVFGRGGAFLAFGGALRGVFELQGAGHEPGNAVHHRDQRIFTLVREEVFP